MDIIEKARELGRAIQAEESYVKLQKYRQKPTLIQSFSSLSENLISRECL